MPKTNPYSLNFVAQPELQPVKIWLFVPPPAVGKVYSAASPMWGLGMRLASPHRKSAEVT